MRLQDHASVRTGGQLLVDALKVHGVDMIFGVPGESYLAALDALHDARDKIKFVNCRHEGGAAFMAEAYGKLTGRPGICFVTRGPGATNASIGIHTAFQDSTPVILLIGQIDNAGAEREAFQEIDYRRMYGPMTKWVAQIDRPDRIPEMMSHAFHLAVSGRPGPVVIALPEDMLAATATAANTARYHRVAAHPGAADMNKLRDMLNESRRPFMILGGSGWNAQACSDIQAFAAANALPAGCTYRCQDLFDNRHPNYAGDISVGLNPALEQRIRAADLLLAIGPRLGEWTTVGYTLIDIPRPKQKFIHVHSGAEELGHVYQGDLLINSGMPEFAAAARRMASVSATWANATKAARADYEAWQQPVATPGALNMSEVVSYLRTRLPPETIVTAGAGTYITWLHRFYRFTGLRTQLGPTSGAMGYGVPSAIAAKLVHPERPVVSFSGDGCFMMNGQELATAKQNDTRVIFIVVNNGIYGTIRMNQEKSYPGRVIGTDLSNPDFTVLARAYGFHAEAVEKTADFAPAFERAWNAKTASLLELRVDPDSISPRTTLSAIRAEALKTNKPKGRNMDRKLAVLGAGAIGGSIGADLAHSGHDVVIIDQWPAHIEAMKSGGLRVVMPDEKMHVAVRAYHLCEVCTLNQQFDFVLLAAKSYDTAWMTEFIKPYLKPDGAVLGVQNGMNNETIASAIGAARTVGCAFELSGEIFTPGLVQRNSSHQAAWFGLGELHGEITSRLHELEKIMSCVGRVSLTTNISGAKWSKLINSSMILAPFGMLGMQSWQATEIPEVIRLCIRLGRETMAVGVALGYRIEPIFGLSAEEFIGSADEIVEKLLRTLLEHHGKNLKKVRGVVLQDYLKGRYTETDSLSGLVARKGKEVNVPTPANEAVTEISRRIQFGELKPERSNLELLQKMLR